MINNSPTNETPNSTGCAIDRARKKFSDHVRERRWDDALGILRENKDVSNMAINGALPLHDACYAKSPLKLIELLLRLNPEGSKVRNENGQLPLSVYFEVEREENDDDDASDTEIEGYVDDEVVSVLIAANPDAPSSMDNTLRFPLHYAAGNKFVPRSSFQRILSAYPAAAKAIDDLGDHALHSACSNWPYNKENEYICEMLVGLLNANPQAAFAKGWSGDLPLILLISGTWNSMSVENMNAFRLVYNANPDGACVTNDQGELPHHDIVSYSEPLTELHLEMFDMLMKANKDAARTPDNDGHLLLHLACTHLPTFCHPILAAILAANPGAIHVKDNSGCTPVQYACRRENDAEEFMQQLFSLSPSGVLLKRLEESEAISQNLIVSLAMSKKHNLVLEKRLENAESTIKKRRLEEAEH